MVEQALRFFQDKEASEPVVGRVNMDAVEAGESVERVFYVKNVVDYPVDVDGFVLKAVSGEAELVESPKKVASGSVEPVKIVLSPDTTDIKPLKFDLEASYTFKTQN